MTASQPASHSFSPDTRWIAVDWGTSNLRAWIMRGTETLERRVSDQGMNGLVRDTYEPVLLDLIGDALAAAPVTPIMVCGMAGSRQGWAEAPYHAVPAPPPGGRDAVRAPAREPRLLPRILPGLRQDAPADVMRGEETQVAGVLAARPGLTGTLCLPGTHTKWVRVEEGRVTAFRTAMTGETFGLLSRRSTLRHSVSLHSLDEESFAEAATRALRDPAALTADLFSLRAEALLHDLKPDHARARLSGLLIGAEMAAMRSFWEVGPVTIVGADALARLYESALAGAGIGTQRLDGEAITLAGLIAAQAQIPPFELGDAPA